MVEYITKGLLVYFIAFLPLLEIYSSVPFGIALGLDYYSTVVLSVIGSYMPVLLLHFGYEQINQIPKAKEWFNKLSSQSLKNWIDNYGIAFVLLITPLIGVWPMAVTMKIFKMNSRFFLIYSFISLVIYAVTMSVIVDLVYKGAGWMPISWRGKA